MLQLLPPKASNQAGAHVNSRRVEQATVRRRRHHTAHTSTGVNVKKCAQEELEFRERCKLTVILSPTLMNVYIRQSPPFVLLKSVVIIVVLSRTDRSRVGTLLIGTLLLCLCNTLSPSAAAIVKVVSILISNLPS